MRDKATPLRMDHLMAMGFKLSPMDVTGHIYYRERSAVNVSVWDETPLATPPVKKFYVYHGIGDNIPGVSIETIRDLYYLILALEGDSNLPVWDFTKLNKC